MLIGLIDTVVVGASFILGLRRTSTDSFIDALGGSLIDAVVDSGVGRYVSGYVDGRFGGVFDTLIAD